MADVFKNRGLPPLFLKATLVEADPELSRVHAIYLTNAHLRIAEKSPALH